MRLFYWILVNASAIGIATWAIPGIGLAPQMDAAERGFALLLVGIIFGLVTSLIRPVVKVLALPAILLTMGLMLLVIDAAMLLITGWVSKQLEVGFYVNGWWAAILGAIIVSIASYILGWVLKEEDDD